MSDGIDLIAIGLLIALLVAICLVDIRERAIPDILNIALALLGFAHAVARDPGTGILIRTAIHVAVAVVMIGGTTELMRLVVKDARIGRGDVKFLIAASFWVGADGVVLVLVLACLTYIAVVLALAPWRGVETRRLRPFAPMLAFGMLVVVVTLFVRRTS